MDLTLWEASIVVILGFGMTFVALSVIIAIVQVMKVTMSRPAKAPDNAAQPQGADKRAQSGNAIASQNAAVSAAAVSTNGRDEDEVVAAIAAVMAAMGDGSAPAALRTRAAATPQTKAAWRGASRLSS